MLNIRSDKGSIPTAAYNLLILILYTNRLFTKKIIQIKQLKLNIYSVPDSHVPILNTNRQKYNKTKQKGQMEWDVT